MLIIHVWNCVKSIYVWIAETFKKPKLRVRYVDLRNGKYVYGTVEKSEEYIRRADLGHPHPFTYWTIRWDNSPAVWKTVLSAKFVWYGGYWTMVER